MFKQGNNGIKAASVLVLLVAANAAHALPMVYSASGAAPANIQPTVDDFRAALGLLRPNLPESFADGRREVNWDGVPDSNSAPNAFPANFFNGDVPGRARGIEFSTPGSGFQVSANAGVAAVEFGNINATYSTQFQPFTAQRLFSPLDSTITDIFFFNPETGLAATSNGFGAVFTDVDLEGSTQINYFDFAGQLLSTQVVATASAGLSFLGVTFDTSQLYRVRVTAGNTALGPDENAATDVVVMDDFIYGEPQTLRQSVPEPGSLWLLVLGLSSIFGGLRGRRVPPRVSASQLH